MCRLTETQKELLAEISPFLAEGPKNTHQLARLRGDRQAYESFLRDRLYRLAERGAVRCKATSRGRFWSLC